jgi:hypothetical protein
METKLNDAKSESIKFELSMSAKARANDQCQREIPSAFFSPNILSFDRYTKLAVRIFKARFSFILCCRTYYDHGV